MRKKAEEAARGGRKPAREIDFFVLALLEALAVVAGVHDNSSQTKFVEAVFLTLGHAGGDAGGAIKRLRKADGWDKYMEALATRPAAYSDLRSAALERSSRRA